LIAGPGGGSLSEARLCQDKLEEKKEKGNISSIP